MMIEKVTVGMNTEYPLAGMLCLPDDLSRPVPAAVLVHGSGPSNMDEKVMKMTPFKDIAEGLQEYGIATLRYDKRTFRYGRKMSKKAVTVHEETIEDALRALEILKSDPRIDSSGIFIIGHSMGAMLAPRIYDECGYARGVVMMAGTPYRLEEVLVRQMKQMEGGSPLISRIVRRQREKLEKQIDEMSKMSDKETMFRKLSGISMYYFREMGRKGPSEYLLENDYPAFIMQGGKDFQVLAEVDYKKFREDLSARDHTEFKLYPDLNHCFVTALSDDIRKVSDEYKTERHIGDEVIGDMADFILRNSRTGTDH